MNMRADRVHVLGDSPYEHQPEAIEFLRASLPASDHIALRPAKALRAYASLSRLTTTRAPSRARRELQSEHAEYAR
jgi:hypothetical protein